MGTFSFYILLQGIERGGQKQKNHRKIEELVKLFGFTD